MNIKEHLLTCLGEECAEIAQDCAKALRFGPSDRNVLDPKGPTNVERLVQELNDLLGVADMLVVAGVLPMGWINKAAQEKKKMKVSKFIAYAREKGTLK